MAHLSNLCDPQENFIRLLVKNEAMKQIFTANGYEMI